MSDTSFEVVEHDVSDHTLTDEQLANLSVEDQMAYNYKAFDPPDLSDPYPSCDCDECVARRS